MLFETEVEAITWYEAQERVLTEDFLKTIPWNLVKDHPIDQSFIPTLLYMRDVERFTSLYNDDMVRTPTGRDPAIKRFMERWNVEEITHSELFDRFLNEAGFPTSEKWFEEAKRKIPWKYKLSKKIQPSITNLIGNHFTSVHMTWGAIHELSVLNGYQRLWELAKHPVLEHVLRGIAREEAMHAFFYWSVARIKLMQSDFRPRLAKFIIEKFWTPVGQGTKPAHETNAVIQTLFSGVGGLELVHQRVTKRIQQLPGLEELQKVTQHIASVTQQQTNLLKT